MKIEKISENQIKFILNQSDLNERNIKLSEFVTNSEKTHDLLREMMDAALQEFDFESDGAPLMIEAMPASSESVMIIVTKISDAEEFDNKLNLIPRNLSKESSVNEPANPSCSEYILIYSFKKLDDVTAASEVLGVDFDYVSRLYKKRNTYYLIIENETETLNLERLEPILSEYGEKQLSTELAKYHILEHGEPYIKNFAVNILSSL